MQSTRRTVDAARPEPFIRRRSTPNPGWVVAGFLLLLCAACGEPRPVETISPEFPADTPTASATPTGSAPPSATATGTPAEAPTGTPTVAASTATATDAPTLSTTPTSPPKEPPTATVTVVPPSTATATPSPTAPPIFTPGSYEVLVARAESFELPTEYEPPPGDALNHHTAGFAKTLCSAVFITGLDPDFAAENVGYFTGPYEERKHVVERRIDYEG